MVPCVFRIDVIAGTSPFHYRMQHFFYWNTILRLQPFSGCWTLCFMAGRVRYICGRGSRSRIHRLILIVFLGHGYIGRLEALLAAVANYRHPYVCMICMNGEENPNAMGEYRSADTWFQKQAGADRCWTVIIIIRTEKNCAGIWWFSVSWNFIILRCTVLLWECICYGL